MSEALDLDNLEWESEDDLGGNKEEDDGYESIVIKETDFDLRLDETLKKQTQINITKDQERESQITKESKVALDDALQKSRVWREAQERKRQEKKERRKALELKINNLKATLLGRIGICININQRSSSFLARILPLLPGSVQVALAESQTVQSVQQLISWIRRTFRRAGPSNTDKIREVDERMLQTKEGSEIAILQILISVARHFGIPSRLIVRFTQAEIFAEADAWAEFYLLNNNNATTSSSSSMETKQWYRAYGSVTRILEAEEEERAWEKNRTIDPNRKKTNHASLDASPRRIEDKPNTVCILGFGDGNALKMVTKRYSSRPVRVNPITKYLQQVMDDWNGSNWNCIPEYAREAHSSNGLMLEDDRLGDSTPMETSVPTTLEGFRKSTDFVLSSHLRWNESLIKGAKPINFFKGEAVYRRLDVARLFNEWGWKKQGRKVRRDELDKPSRVLPKKTKIDMSTSFNHDDAAAVLNESPGGVNNSNKKKKKISTKEKDEEKDKDVDMDIDSRRKLYSEFQTDPVDPGQIDEESGKIPLNEFGNVELFNPSLIPRGGVHLTGSNVEKACQELQVPFACAVVGFEWRDGKTRPKFQGVVVGKTNEELVCQAAEDITIRTKKQEEEAATKLTGADLWRELLVPQSVVLPKPNSSSLNSTTTSPNKSTTSRVVPANSSAIAAAKNKMAEKYVEAGLQKLEKRAKVELCDDHQFANGVCEKCGRKQADVEYF